MAGYYRFQAYAVRAILVIWWLGAIGISLSYYLAEGALPQHWWLLYLIGLPGTGVFWLVSSFMLTIAEKK